MDSEGNPITRDDLRSRQLEGSLLPQDLAFLRSCSQMPTLVGVGASSLVGIMAFQKVTGSMARRFVVSLTSSTLIMFTGSLLAFTYCNDKYTTEILSGRIIISNREQALQQLKRTPLPTAPYFPSQNQQGPYVPAPGGLAPYPPTQKPNTQYNYQPSGVQPPSQPFQQYPVSAPLVPAAAPVIEAAMVDGNTELEAEPLQTQTQSQTQPSTGHIRSHSNRRSFQANPGSPQNPIPNLMPQQRTLALPPHLQIQALGGQAQVSAHPYPIQTAQPSIPPGRTLAIPAHLQNPQTPQNPKPQSNQQQHQAAYVPNASLLPQQVTPPTSVTLAPTSASTPGPALAIEKKD